MSKPLNYGASRSRRINQVVKNYEGTRTRFNRAPSYQNTADPRSPRRAKCQGSASGTTVLAKLLDSDAAEVGDVITVNLFKTSTESFPIIASGNIIPIFKDVNGSWYACFVMIPFTECAE